MICRQNSNQEQSCNFKNVATFKKRRHVIAPAIDRRAENLATKKKGAFDCLV